MPWGARPRRLRTQLVLALAGILAAVLIGAGGGLVLLHASANQFERVAVEVVEETAVAEAVSAQLSEANKAGGEFLEDLEPDARREFDRLRPRVDAGILALRGFDEEDEREHARAAQAAWARARRLATMPARAVLRDASDGALDTEDQFEAEIERAESSVLALRASAGAEIETQLATTNRDEARDWAILWVTLAVALALAALLARWLTRSILGPLGSLEAAATAFGRGQLARRVPVAGPTELERVARTFNDMASALTESRARLERQAYADALTGLPNRARFTEAAAAALARGPEHRVAVLFIDLDDFKLVNDSLGHALGDEMLREAGDRLRRCLRAGDLGARLGGDEFAVLLEGEVAVAGAAGVSERIIAALRRPFDLQGSEVFVGASIGIALAGGADGELSHEVLLREADLAMYHAKERGKGSYAVFRPALREETAGRLQLAADLRRALERDELVVHYQPIVEFERGHVVALEALVRWEHPTRGLLGPDRFVPLAEQTGLIVGVGAWVLHEACRRAASWGTAGPTVTVNLSARQLLEPDLVEEVARALQDCALAPHRLMLEITETAIMGDIEAGVKTLERLRRLGVQLAIDDFGTGYSSLSYLRRLPVQALKIARPFVQEMQDGPRDSALVRGIVELGRSLGLQLIAEGIEVPEQAERLGALGCDLGQGFLFARPVTADAVPDLLDRSLLPAVDGHPVVAQPSR